MFAIKRWPQASLSFKNNTRPVTYSRHLVMGQAPNFEMLTGVQEVSFL